jgi:hypothetical protein
MTEPFANDTLFEQACKHFGVPGGVASFAKPNKERAAKRKRIAKTIDRFRAVMSRPNPPRTKQEAVEAIAPLLTIILSMVFKQFAIEVIEWLWDQLESQDSER